MSAQISDRATVQFEIERLQIRLGALYHLLASRVPSKFNRDLGPDVQACLDAIEEMQQVLEEIDVTKINIANQHVILRDLPKAEVSVFLKKQAG